jgi:dipeptide/tripeptide permease
VLLGEIFSTDAKKIVAPLALMACFVSSFIVTLVFPLLSEAVGMHVMFYFFTISCVIGVIFTLKIIPETKGKSLLEIQKLLGSQREIDLKV